MRRKAEQRIRELIETQGLSEQEAIEKEQDEWDEYQDRQYQIGRDRARGIEP